MNLSFPAVPLPRPLAAQLVVAVLLTAPQLDAQEDPLPSWSAGATRDAIVAFVKDVSTEGAPGYVPAAERIAVFDNDGTLWSEQPMYVQLAFILDRVRELAPEHPEWRQRQPFRGALDGDLAAVAAAGKRGLLEMAMATHAGMTSDEFSEIASAWIRSARHPRYDRAYFECVYQPMLELLAYLRHHGFKTFIVSGGGIEFMRPWTESVYGIPPEQVVGSSIKTSYELRDDVPVLVRQPELDFVDDKAGKPVGIHAHIGRRPILAVGNSDGDLEMLQWTTIGRAPSLGVLVHHTDAEREVAYDRESHFGRLDRALDEASQRGWLVVDMKRDWRTIFPPASAAN
jgi:phosphoglycolate phosphatase-like HAD superfamily hydrolase